MQVGRASEFLSLVAFSGLVAGPAWAGQVFDRSDDKGGGDPRGGRPPTTHGTAGPEDHYEAGGC